MKRFVAILALLALLAPASAWSHANHGATLKIVDVVTGASLKGGFSPVELAGVNAVRFALHDLSDAVIASVPGPDTYLFYEKITAAFREGFEAYALFLHIDPEAFGSLFDSRETQGRAAWVADAFFHLDRCRSLVAAARLAAEADGQPSAVAGNFLPNALAKLASVDRSKAYATPLPPDSVQIAETPNGRFEISRVAVTPSVAGPHGELRRQGWALHRSVHYFLDAWEHALAAYAAHGVQPGTAEVFRKGAEFLRVMDEAMGVAWGLDATGEPPPERSDMPRRFLSTQEVWKWLTRFENGWTFSTPFRLQEVIRALCDWSNATHDAALLSAIESAGDAWRHSDQAMWDGILFTFLNEDPDAGR